ncbi:biotin transporter BioY [Bordetella bronchialis]|uniref:Biotin transporter n=1 Tax=Bordetella bronchialis TaxID=463025 RepID=A0A193FLQ2_9BORD|nr:biotin transporter BioY [Bordetella bronchialis]ANN68034.1 BioY family transporter [Bordetella bronchialis]ANN73126.1 BioY family transporter [Bordetella bronchialis]
MRTKDTVTVALFAAFIVVLSLAPPIPVPALPVPITLQALGVMLAGCMLGPARGAAAVALYLVLAAIGLPVLPGGRGGLGVYAGPTGGFLIGMLVGAALCGAIAQRVGRSGAGTLPAILGYFGAALAGGLVVVYAVGIPWLAAIAGMTLAKAAAAMAVFLPGDIAKAIVAAVVTQRVRRVWAFAHER